MNHIDLTSGRRSCKITKCKSTEYGYRERWRTGMIFAMLSLGVCRGMEAKEGLPVRKNPLRVLDRKADIGWYA